MITLNSLQALMLNREETLVLIDALMHTVSGEADDLLWRLGEIYRSFEADKAGATATMRHESDRMTAVEA